MVSVIYFLLFALVLLLISYYVISKTSCYPSTDITSVKNIEPSKQELSFFINQPTFFGIKKKNKISDSDNSNISIDEIKNKIKKHNSKLKRNLLTLNYISIIEKGPDVIENPKRLEDILNLKKSVQREVIRNTKQINYYKSLIK